MEQYIKKSALLAEIKRLIKYSEMVADHNTQITELVSRELDALYHLISFLDTLEVKEINSTDAFICKARKYFYKELPNFRSFMESGTAFIKNFESFIQGE